MARSAPIYFNTWSDCFLSSSLQQVILGISWIFLLLVHVKLLVLNLNIEVR